MMGAMPTTPAADFKSTCIKCAGMEFTDVIDSDGNVTVARKCVKCGLISVMFNTTV